MQRTTFLAVLILGIMFISGCASIPPISFSVPNVGKASHKIDAELKSITVTLARADEATGDIDVAGVEDQVANIWKTSLQEAFNKMLIFNDNSVNKASLSVKVLKLDLPAAGITMVTEAAAKYELISRNNGDIIFSTTINTEGVCPADYAFAGIVRARESGNRAVQNNISQFLQALNAADVVKPTPPGKN